MEWTYTTKVDHAIRRQLGVSTTEYCILDYIQNVGHRSVGAIAKEFALSKGGVSNTVNKLIGMGYLNRRIMSDSVAMAKIWNNTTGLGCIGCGELKNLHDHHYPVRKKDGGKETVSLCANCHADFHEMTDHGILEIKINLNAL